jgi:hypothetical protein
MSTPSPVHDAAPTADASSRARRIVLPASARPILLVVVDTEEEFDWSLDFDRRNTGVAHMHDIEKLQRVFDEFSIRPVYVVDHPIASQTESIAALKPIHDSRRCEIGAHLHPWVTPPFEEEVNRRNSYPGNLPRELEQRKLAELVRAIESGFSVRPRSYKAGRYGFGANTAAILDELGFEVDLSPCPAFDLSDDGGPDYSAFTTDPRWLDGAQRVLSIPTSGAYVGFVKTGASGLYRLITKNALKPLRLPGILARIGALERLHLSPEGYAFEDNRRLTRALHHEGVRTFTFAMHSPSVKPGCTPYVRTDRDLVQFLDSCRRYFEFFLRELGGASMTALELRRHLESFSKDARA